MQKYVCMDVHVDVYMYMYMQIILGGQRNTIMKSAKKMFSVFLIFVFVLSIKNNYLYPWKEWKRRACKKDNPTVLKNRIFFTCQCSLFCNFAIFRFPLR